MIIERKVDSLQRCVQRVRDRCPDDASILKQDLDAQDILVLNLSRAVQICVDIAAHLLAELEQPPPQTMGESFDRLAAAGRLEEALALRLRKAVGFRNIAVHAYTDIDWEIVHAIASRSLGDFEAFARAVIDG